MGEEGEEEEEREREGEGEGDEDSDSESDDDVQIHIGEIKATTPTAYGRPTRVAITPGGPCRCLMACPHYALNAH